ncbi:MAG: transcriptional regulator, GntR family [Rhodoglobus sp.]|nr:transcriptional regulator, GntR family [Rhodoglobus sp.]
MIARNKLRDEVISAVLAIIEGDSLGPGDTLPPERELSATLGVSRTVVREALTALEMQGLLVLVPGRRPTIQLQYERAFGETLGLAMRKDENSLKQLMEVRWIIENSAAALAAARATAGDIEALGNAIARMREHLDEPSGYVDADVAFHEALLVATGNDVLVSMMRPAAGLLARSRELTTGSRRPPSSALEEHIAIFERISAGDVEGAREASARHMAATIEDLESVPAAAVASTFPRVSART